MEDSPKMFTTEEVVEITDVAFMTGAVLGMAGAVPDPESADRDLILYGIISDNDRRKSYIRMIKTLQTIATESEEVADKFPVYELRSLFDISNEL